MEQFISVILFLLSLASCDPYISLDFVMERNDLPEGEERRVFHSGAFTFDELYGTLSQDVTLISVSESYTNSVQAVAIFLDSEIPESELYKMKFNSDRSIYYTTLPTKDPYTIRFYRNMHRMTRIVEKAGGTFEIEIRYQRAERDSADKIAKVKEFPKVEVVTKVSSGPWAAIKTFWAGLNAKNEEEKGKLDSFISLDFLVERNDMPEGSNRNVIHSGPFTFQELYYALSHDVTLISVYESRTKSVQSVANFLDAEIPRSGLYDEHFDRYGNIYYSIQSTSDEGDINFYRNMHKMTRIIKKTGGKLETEIRYKKAQKDNNPYAFSKEGGRHRVRPMRVMFSI